MLSVVIPTLDEEQALPRTLDAVLAQAGEFEVVVVDGGSSDGTCGIVESAGIRCPSLCLVHTERGRARQLNAGAGVARGQWLLFLHADTVLPEGAVESIIRLPASVHAGCFRHRFSGSSRLLRVLSWFHNRRFRVTRVVYGDQAMFIRRVLFDELGGFPDRDMEDIAFSLALRKATTPVMLPLHVTTDSRKFDQMGHWRALGRAVRLLVHFRLGRDVSGDRFFTDYR